MPFYTDFPLYPTELLNTTDYPDQNDDIDWALADHVNALRDEMIAVQTELGTVPKGGYADVKTRLDYYTAWQNYTQSAGRVSGGAVTDGGGGTANIAAGSGYFKTTDLETGVTVLLSWSLVEGLALVDNAVNYIHVNYNAGTPAVQTTTDRTTIELNREFTLARISRSGTTLHIINSGVNLPNLFRKQHERLLSVRGFERAAGGEISETGTRNIASTIGRFYLGLNHVDTTAKDTAVADTFSSWYRDDAGGWTEVTAQTQIDNGYYDDGSGTLHALTANRYAVFWVYIHFDSDLHVIYGQGDYKITEAEDAVLPDSLPDQVKDFGTLAAKIIIKKNAAAFTSIVSAYKTLFPVSSPPDHNDLGGLQGGQADQYYHINNTQFTALGPKGITAIANLVASNWVTRASAADNDWYGICWSPELTLFCAVAGSGVGNRVMTSPDGINWTIRTSAADSIWYSVCWSPELTLFCAVAVTGNINTKVMTSPDGITWTTRTSFNNDWRTVCWSPELTLFCAVAISGNKAMTSPDGINWTSRTPAADLAWRTVCWSPELTLFCAVAATGVGNRVMTSPDGINWTIRTSAADNDWIGVCWSPELTLFCAVSQTGVGNRVMTSPDGINWTIRTSAADNSWFHVCWSPELGLFCAAAPGAGVGNRVMTSPDGINWTIRTSATDNGWRRVCWSPELGLFCAVAAAIGVGNRVMTSLYYKQ